MEEHGTKEICSFMEEYNFKWCDSLSKRGKKDLLFVDIYIVRFRRYYLKHLIIVIVINLNIQLQKQFNGRRNKRVTSKIIFISVK